MESNAFMFGFAAAFLASSDIVMPVASVTNSQEKSPQPKSPLIEQEMQRSNDSDYQQTHHLSSIGAGARQDTAIYSAGGGDKCLSLQCRGRALWRGWCYDHGGRAKCETSGCLEEALRNGFCGEHGGADQCLNAGEVAQFQGNNSLEESDTSSQSKPGKCINHGKVVGAGRELRHRQKCAYSKCTERVRMDGSMCLKHADCKLCTHPGCFTTARLGRRECAIHSNFNGARRCAHRGCTKTVKRAGRCTVHLKPSRCAHAGCVKLATKFGGKCANHGDVSPCSQRSLNPRLNNSEENIEATEEIEPSATETATSSHCQSSPGTPENVEIPDTSTIAGDTGAGEDFSSEDEYVERLLGLDQLKQQCARAGCVKQALVEGLLCIEHSILPGSRICALPTCYKEAEFAGLCHDHCMELAKELLVFTK